MVCRELVIRSGNAQLTASFYRQPRCRSVQNTLCNPPLDLSTCTRADLLHLRSCCRNLLTKVDEYIQPKAHEAQETQEIQADHSPGILEPSSKHQHRSATFHAGTRTISAARGAENSTCPNSPLSKASTATCHSGLLAYERAASHDTLGDGLWQTGHQALVTTSAPPSEVPTFPRSPSDLSIAECSDNSTIRGGTTRTTMHLGERSQDSSHSTHHLRIVRSSATLHHPPIKRPHRLPPTIPRPTDSLHTDADPPPGPPCTQAGSPVLPTSTHTFTHESPILALFNPIRNTCPTPLDSPVSPSPPLSLLHPASISRRSRPSDVHESYAVTHAAPHGHLPEGFEASAVDSIDASAPEPLSDPPSRPRVPTPSSEASVPQPPRSKSPPTPMRPARRASACNPPVVIGFASTNPARFPSAPTTRQSSGNLPDLDLAPTGCSSLLSASVIADNDPNTSLEEKTLACMLPGARSRRGSSTNPSNHVSPSASRNDISPTPPIVPGHSTRTPGNHSPTKSPVSLLSSLGLSSHCPDARSVYAASDTSTSVYTSGESPAGGQCTGGGTPFDNDIPVVLRNHMAFLGYHRPVRIASANSLACHGDAAVARSQSEAHSQSTDDQRGYLAVLNSPGCSPY